MVERPTGKTLFALPPIVFFVFFLLVPLGQVAARGLPAVPALLKDAAFRQSVGHSFTVSAAASVLTVILAFVLAYTVHRTRLPQMFKRLVSGGAKLPMLLPTVTYGFAILYSFGKQGLLTRLCGGHMPEFYGFPGLLLGYCIYTLPTAFILLSNSLRYIDQRFQLVSQLMGDSRLFRFWITTLRPLLGTLGAAFLQSFFLCFTDFGVPLAIGGQYTVVSMSLYRFMLGALPDFAKGAAAALVMLLPTLASILLLRWLRRFDFRYEQLSFSRQFRRPCHDAVCAALSGAIITALGAVFVVLLVVPFVQSWPYVPVFSLAHISGLFTTPRLLQIYCNSLLTAGSTALCGTLLAYLCAFLHVRTRISDQIKRALDSAAALTNTVPGMVLGIGFLFAFTATPLQYTFSILIFCNVVHFFNTPYTMAKQALSKLSVSWETSAALLGDRWWQTAYRILLPNTWPSILEMFSYYFVNAMVTISAIIFLSGAHTMVITTRIKELQQFAQFDEIFALSLLILLTNLVVKALLSFVSQNPKVKTCAVFWRAILPAMAFLILFAVSRSASSADQVVIYSNADEEAIHIFAQTLDAHGYTGQYIVQSFSTSELGGRLLAEGAALEADIITLNEYYLASAQTQNHIFLEPGYSPALPALQRRYAAPMIGTESTLIVNQAALKDAGLPVPASLRELASPIYMGQLSVPSIEGSSTGWMLVQAVLDQYGEQEGQEILTGLLGNAGPHVESSGSGPLKKVAAGETALAFGLRRQAERASQQGIPVFCLSADCAYAMTESLALLDKGAVTKPLAKEIALCLQTYARPALIREYPLALYPNEADPHQARRYPAELTAGLLDEHIQFFRSCVGQPAG